MPARRYLTACALGAVAVTAYVTVVLGALTLDLGVGRSTRGPLSWSIAAPRELVYEVISAPYLRKTPRALEQKLRVLERGVDMVLAERRSVARWLPSRRSLSGEPRSSSTPSQARCTSPTAGFRTCPGCSGAAG